MTIEPLESRRLFATVPSGFVDTQLVTGLSNPTAMEFAPDGRLFVSQQGGALRVIKNGALLATPFMTLTVDSAGERGLLGVAFDPGFATNRFLYVYYTVPAPSGGSAHNRVSRFTASSANPDTVQAGSEVPILDLDNLSSATNHNGGSIHFGPDGKLYVAVGENANSANSQTLNNRLGKMLRINPDGTIPTDNPFYATAAGANRSIWAMGLRNPFTFAFQPGTGTMYINDVGESTWEEINVGVAGANYGWPIIEGARTTQTPPANYHDPFFTYRHPFTGSDPTQVGIAITGGAFYTRPASVANAPSAFPASAQGDYFYADLGTSNGGNWIRTLDAGTANSSLFATGLNTPVDLKVGADGALYYLERGNNGRIGRIANAVASPTTPDLAAASDTGISNADNVTNIATPTFTGSAPVGSTVQIFSDGGAALGSAVVGAGGTYSIAITPLSDGTHAITAVATLSGNASAISDPLSITVDRAAPAVASGSFEFDTAQRVRFVFSENVAASLDTSDLTVENLDTSTTLPASAFSVSTTSGAGNATTGIWTATATLADGNYRATLPGLLSNGITDVAGNALGNNGVVDFFVLSADANRDRHINALDFNALASHYGATSGGTLSTGDFNYDGKVDNSDFTILGAKFGTYLAPLPSQPLSARMPKVASSMTGVSLFSDRAVAMKDSVLD